MQEEHFPERFLIPWWIDVQPWSLSNENTSSPRKYLIIAKKIPHLVENTRGMREPAPGIALFLEPREFLSFCAECGTQIFGFAFTRSHTAAGFIIFVLRERERLCPPKSPCSNNSSGKTVFMVHRIPYGSLYLF